MATRNPEAEGAFLGLVFGGIIFFLVAIFPMWMAGSSRGNIFTFLMTDGHCWTLSKCDWRPGQ